MNSVFSEQILADKLSKLNNTQQCIETLSHWCIFHRQKAEQVVQTWDKQFHSSDKEHKISFLYLANDILQNSKRKGTEFVGEFWKVLPAALKDVLDNGDDRGKNVVSRLVGIWEDRRVFGSRARGLKDLMLGNEPLPALDLNKKRSRSIKILRRDSRSMKIKLSVGGTAEKIVSAFHSLLSEHPSEDVDLKKCKDVVHHVGKMEKSVNAACSSAGDPLDPKRVSLVSEIQEQETLLKECVEELKSIEASRAALVSQLKEALREQESGLENVRTQLQVAHAQIEEAANMKRRLNNEPTIPSSNPLSVSPSQIDSSAQNKTTPKRSAAAIAAEVADRLAASTHSQQIMTSVLSSLAAEEAKNARSTPSTVPNGSDSATEKKLKHEKPMTASDTSFAAAQPAAMTAAARYHTIVIPQAPVQAQAMPQQPQYNVFQAPSQQYFQPTGGGVMIGVPYTYSSVPAHPPVPPPPQVMNLARPSHLNQQVQTHMQPMGLMQQPQLTTQITLKQPMPPNQQPLPTNLQQPVHPTYRAVQSPGMAYFHQPQ